MPKICEKCKEEFPFSIEIDGKKRNLNSRKYCLGCSPFGKHNTKKIQDSEFKQVHRICKKCNIKKDIDDFYKRSRNDSYHHNCKKCFNLARTECFRNNKIEAVKYKGGKCERCKYDKYVGALEFHHLNPEEKDFSMSSYRGTGINNKVKEELDKCIMLCVNCHREEHDRIIKLKELEDD
jgi:5-methylcytosine-specific restriction endonuclease McrA